MGTKNSNESVLNALQCLNFSDTKLVSPHSPGGRGLALLWNKGINIQILSGCQNFIDTFIEVEGQSFFATFICGEPEKSKRKEIWDKLSIIGQDRADSWFFT